MRKPIILFLWWVFSYGCITSFAWSFSLGLSFDWWKPFVAGIVQACFMSIQLVYMAMTKEKDK